MNGVSRGSSGPATTLGKIALSVAKSRQLAGALRLLSSCVEDGPEPTDGLLLGVIFSPARIGSEEEAFTYYAMAAQTALEASATVSSPLSLFR